MIITLKNEALEVQVSTKGAEMQAIRTPEGGEYLWDGQAQFWGSRATNLFPYVGRLFDKGYLWQGKRYELGIHGFFRYMDCIPRERGDSRVYLEAGADGDTLRQYPFPFRAGIDYRLEGRTLLVTHRVHNTGDGVMPLGLGGHPGFRLPLEEGLLFEDYALHFPQPPSRLLMSENCLMTGQEEPFALEDGRLPLRHELFDHDAIVLRNPGGSVSLLSDKGKRGLVLRHPQMKYLGIWHRPQSTAPYVCLEPWLSLPGNEGELMDLARQPDLVQLPAGETYQNTWSIEILA